MNLKNIFIFLSLLFLLSCNDAYFQAEKEFEHSVWTYNDPFTFSFTARDTQKIYNFLLEIKHGTSYPHQNIYFQVATIFPDNDTIRDPFSVNLADKFGHWNGDCWGNSCSLLVPIQQNVRFKQLGEHTLQFHQYSRQDSLIGIEELSFSIKEVSK